jgi:DNA-binding HxlR family transcriptional regulator
MIPKSQWRSSCPIACALDLLGDRWSLLVIRDLFCGKQYFDEFLSAPEGIATNILSARLAWLTDKGIITRKPSAKDKRRMSYQLTARGQSLKDVVLSVAHWGLKNFPGTAMERGT